MKIYITEKVLVETSRKELLLCRQGASKMLEFANTQIERCKFKGDTRKIWTRASKDFHKLVQDIDKIIDSMPF